MPREPCRGPSAHAVSRKPTNHYAPEARATARTPDFRKLDAFEDKLSGYDGCFYCAGVSSAGKNEADYTSPRSRTRYSSVAFATTLARLNPAMVFTYVTERAHRRHRAMGA